MEQTQYKQIKSSLNNNYKHLKQNNMKKNKEPRKQIIRNLALKNLHDAVKLGDELNYFNKPKNTNTDQTNEQVIKDYFQTHGYETKEEMLKFLFDMQTNFIKTGDWTEEYRDNCLYKFEILFDLVKGLNYAEDKIETKISLN